MVQLRMQAPMHLGVLGSVLDQLGHRNWDHWDFAAEPGARVGDDGGQNQCYSAPRV